MFRRGLDREGGPSGPSGKPESHPAEHGGGLVGLYPQDMPGVFSASVVEAKLFAVPPLLDEDASGRYFQQPHAVLAGDIGFSLRCLGDVLQFLAGGHPLFHESRPPLGIGNDIAVERPCLSPQNYFLPALGVLESKGTILHNAPPQRTVLCRTITAEVTENSATSMYCIYLPRSQPQSCVPKTKNQHFCCFYGLNLMNFTIKNFLFPKCRIAN